MSARSISGYTGFIWDCHLGAPRLLRCKGPAFLDASHLHGTFGRRQLPVTNGPLTAGSPRTGLHLPAQDTVQLSWVSRNCSYSEFLFSGDRFTLSSFNSYPHLKKDLLLTYR
jgi:hypothetical protein